MKVYCFLLLFLKLTKEKQKKKDIPIFFELIVCGSRTKTFRLCKILLVDFLGNYQKNLLIL